MATAGSQRTATFQLGESQRFSARSSPAARRSRRRRLHRPRHRSARPSRRSSKQHPPACSKSKHAQRACSRSNDLRNLQGIFGYYFDKALWDEVTDLFADDGTIELGLNGVYAGKANIRKYLYSLTGGKAGLRPGELMNHFQLSPVVTLADDGLSAKARWRTIIQAGTSGKGSGR